MFSLFKLFVFFLEALPYEWGVAHSSQNTIHFLIKKMSATC